MPHGFGVLFGPADNSSITFVGNLMAHVVERNPLSRAADLVMVNNLVYNRDHWDVDLASEDGRISKTTVVGNEFLRGPSQSNTRSRSSAHQRRVYAVSRQYACMFTTTARRTSAAATRRW